MDYQRLVKELRNKLILSQQEFADLLDVSFSSINRWETGKHEPTIKVKRKIVDLCKINGIDIEEQKNGKKE
jgi:DNA-binding XRE family transcriptional regulator